MPTVSAGDPARPEIKHLDPAALAGLTTGTLLTAFPALHEAAEHVMGHPIWTHQFPVLSGKLRAAVLARFPDMPTHLDPAGWEATRDAVRARFGEAVAVARGGQQGIGPLNPAGFPEGERERVHEATMEA